jgi:hypothetical protein
MNSFGMESAVYHEWVPAGTFVKALVGAVSVSIFLLVLILGVALHPLTLESFLGVGVLIVTLVLILVLYLNFRGIRIQVSAGELRVDYGLLNHKRIRLTDIKSCRVVTASFRRFGGVGVRYDLDGSWAYTTSFGNAVEIVPQSGRTFVFSSDHPDEVCQILSATLHNRA